MNTPIHMPQLGESVVEGTVGRWLKSVGERIERFEPLLEISTDKVETEIPSPVSGLLLAIYVQEGETVGKGTLLAEIGEEMPALAPAATHNSAPAESNAAGEREAADTINGVRTGTGNGEHGGGAWHVTPVVARMAAQHKLDLAAIAGSGRGGRVTKKDVEAYLAAGAKPAEAAPWETPGSGSLFKPSEEYAEAAGSPAAHHDTPPPLQAAPRLHPVETIPQAAGDQRVPLSPMRKAIAERMVFSKLRNAPHVTTVFEVDLTRVLAHRTAHLEAFAVQGVNLTLTAYFVAASVEALKATPYINAEWSDDGIILHRHIHVGIAVALDEGLIVPVLRDAGERNLLGIARAVNDMATRARAKQLSADEVRGGTFTITNHGVSGSLFATPILVPPQVGILGVGVMEQRVKVIDGMIAIRPCAYVSLTFDHRVADGATGDGFMLVLKRALESWGEFA
jgi:2-oxoglutarate dehydrogenase E2 component (dihydrolipoamide succinyltransferase)